MTAQVFTNVRIDRWLAATYKRRAEQSACTAAHWVGKVLGVALSNVRAERQNESCGKNSLFESLYRK